MTQYEKQNLSWWQWQTQTTGKTEAEIRQFMREKGAKANRKKAGFGGTNPEIAAQIRAKSIKVRQTNAAQKRGMTLEEYLAQRENNN